MKYSRKHILNKHLKSKTPDGVELYPVYLQVIYKRKNYPFKSLVRNYYANIQDINGEDLRIVAEELNLLDSILKFELESKGDKFDLAGFSDKFNQYRRSVVEQAERLMLGMLEAFLKQSYRKYLEVINFKYSPGKYRLLLDTLILLYPEISNDIDFGKYKFAFTFWHIYQQTFPEVRNGEFIRPAVFDWIAEDHLKVMMNKIKHTHGLNTFMDFEYLEKFDYAMKQITIGA